MRVAIALSGGTDSAAAALILKREGFEPVGLTMLTHPEGEASCLAAGDLARAIGIEHRVIDLRSAFRQMVIDPFVRSYLAGLTPNPCVACNRELKFGALLERAREMGLEGLATGHYARVDASGRVPRLLAARDAARDQSYALWTLDADTLSRVMFPLGDLTRKESEELVCRAGLGATVRPPSQDICFLEGEDYRSMLARSGVEPVPGPILDAGGKTLGRHRGLACYTVGQRKGLGVSSGEAMYVIEIRPEDNTIVVGGIDKRHCSRFQVAGIGFVSGDAPGSSFECEVVTRYRGPRVAAMVEVAAGGLGVVRCDVPGPPAAPGQSAVFYDGDEVLGGGIITRKDKDSLEGRS